MIKKISRFLAAAFLFQSIAATAAFPVKVTAASAYGTTMNLESIADNSYISDKISVSGWALLPSGVKSIAVTLDGNSLGTVTNVVRYDVSAVYPSYAAKNPDSGYVLNANLDLSKYSAGSHTLKVSVTGNDPSETEYRSITVNKAAPNMNLESVQEGGMFSGDINARGWAVNASGVSKINYYIDGILKKSSSFFVARPDVYIIVDKYGYYNYKGAYMSGYDDTIDISSYSGTHTFTAEAVGYDGQKTGITHKISITKPASRMNLESVANNSYISDTVNISGWALLPSGAAGVRAYLDGNDLGAVSSVARYDVSAAFPSYAANNPTSGFKLNASLDLSKYAVGNHTLKVVVTGKDQTESISATRNVIKAAPNMNLESVQEGGTYMGSVRFTGWAVNASGVAKVNCYIDGKLNKTVLPSSFVSRPDVYGIVDKNGYYNYKGADKSGYSDWADVSGYSGKHTVTVEAVGYDGQSAKMSKTINILAPQSRLIVDSPSGNAYYIKSSMEFTGWVLMPAGVSSMKLSIDGNDIPVTVTYKYRSDVDYCYPSYTALNPTAGYDVRASIDGSAYYRITSGSHSVVLTAYGKDGSKIEHAMTMSKAAPAMNIENPSSSQNYSFKDSSITVSGWTVNTSGVKEVDLYVNSTLQKSIVTADTPLSQRDDVEIIVDKNGVVGYSDAGHSGYSFSLDTSSFGYGFSIKVVSAGYDGATASASFDFNKSHTAYTHYNTTESTLVSVNKSDVYKYCSGYNLTASNIDPGYIVNSSVQGKYQFMNLDFVNVSVDGLNQMVSGCGYLNGQGQTFWNAGSKYNVNPVYLAAHALWETGYGTSKLSKGENPDGTYIGYFNMFGYGAVDWDPINGGNSYAAAHNWNSPEAAITGGAQVISYNYIHNSQVAGHYDQDTLYTMKWDPQHTAVHGTQGTEYATDYNWPNGIARIIYKNSYLFNGQQINFDIPAYN